MNTSEPSNRRNRREARPAPEALEGRELLTGGVGGTFAIVPGVVAKAGHAAVVHFTIDSAHFTLPKGKFTLGIDVASANGSTLKPQIGAVSNPSGGHVTLSHGKYTAHLPTSTAVKPGTSTAAVTTTVQLDRKHPNGPATYSVSVRGMNGTTGNFLLGFYLPGDADGDGKVTQTDLTAIQAEQGFDATNAKYTFDADSNRDGVVNATDLAIALKNVGVGTTVNPTASSHLDTTGETMAGSRAFSVPSAHFTGVVTPGAKVTYQSTAAGSKPVTATADTTGNYSLVVPLVSGNNTFNVTTLDAFRQSIGGTIAAVSYVPPAPASGTPKTS